MAGPQARRSVEDLTQALYEASDPDGTPWVRCGRVNAEELRTTFEFVSFGTPLEHRAYICVGTGKIYCHSLSDGPKEEEDLPEVRQRRRSRSSPRRTGASRCGSPASMATA
jgi:hypothetical protein